MKKMIAMMLALVLCFGLVACGGSDNGAAADGFAADSATAVLEAVWNSYPEEQKFPVMGGDYDNLVDGAPGAFDFSNAEYMESLLAVPADAAAMVDDAASLIHGMMANNFTCGAFHIADASNTDAFVSAVKESIANRQWLCGQPEKMVIVSDGSYVVAMFGLGDVVTAFAEQLAEMGGTVMVDEAIA